MLNRKSINHILFSFLALFTTGCNPPSEPGNVNEQAVWGDDMTYAYLDEDEPDGKQALKIAKKYGHFKNYYARFKIGNLGIVDASTPPPSYVMDAESKSGTCAIILGKNPAFVQLPNKDLFAHYMKQIRPNPNQHKPEQRFHIISVLAGVHEPLTKDELQNNYKNILEYTQIEPQSPTWIDENGTLTIEYYSSKSEGNMAPYLIKCTLIVDSEQQYQLNCSEVTLP